MKNTVIIIDDAHKLVPDYKSNSICPLDYIIEPIGRWNGMANKPIVIILGNKKLDSYLCEHPETAAVIGHKFSLPNISLDGMTKNSPAQAPAGIQKRIKRPGCRKITPYLCKRPPFAGRCLRRTGAQRGKKSQPDKPGRPGRRYYGRASRAVTSQR